jgi:hypothetical protein
MKYDREVGYWVVVLDGKEYGMHCGEWFDLFLSDTQSAPCRLEWDQNWYVVMMKNVRLNLRKQEIYKIEV